MDSPNEKPQAKGEFPATSTSRTATVARARETLSRDYDITAAFVRVGTLSKILGISTATIYAAIRGNRFFLPHRMLCSSPVVKLDDIAAWYAETNEAIAPIESDKLSDAATESADRNDSAETERMVAQTLANMARRAKTRSSGTP